MSTNPPHIDATVPAGRSLRLADADVITADTQGELVQLAHSSADETGFRTNLGLLNTTALQVEVSIDLHRASGGLLGTLTLMLQPFEREQVDKVFAGVTATAVDDGCALLTSSTAGARFLAYASVVDNRSGDAVFMPGQLTPARSPSSAVIADHRAADAFSGLAAADIESWDPGGAFHPDGDDSCTWCGAW